MQSTDVNITVGLNFLAVLNLLGAAQGVLLALALLTTKGANETANRLLAALTLTISIVVSGAVLLTSNYVFVFPHLSRIHQPFGDRRQALRPGDRTAHQPRPERRQTAFDLFRRLDISRAPGSRVVRAGRRAVGSSRRAGRAAG
jgi:hypothetical protein